MLNVNRNPKAYSKNGEKGRGGVMWWGKSIYRYTVTTRMAPALMGIDESHFNVSLIVKTKLQDSAHKPQPFLKKKGEPKRNRAAAILLRLTPRPNRLSLSLSLSGSLSPKLVKAG